MSLLPYPFSALTLIVGSYVVHVIWSRRRVQRAIASVPAPKSASFWTGNLPLLYDPHRGWPFLDSIQDAGSIFRLTTPIGFNDMIYVADPLALYSIYRKDEASFEEPDDVFIIESVVFGNDSIFCTEGAKHRKQRKFLNPIFSTAHMKKMVPIFCDVSHKLRSSLQLMTAKGPVEVDMVNWLTRTALELIGQAGIGYTFDSLTIEETPNVYGAVLKEGVSAISSPTLRMGMKYVLPFVAGMGTPGFWKAIIDHIPLDVLQSARHFVLEMDRSSKEIYKAKKKALTEGDETLTKQIMGGNDLISLLMRANMSAQEEERLTDEEVVAQISSFVFAATDTTSSALSRTLCLLAEHPTIQDRLREEILNAKRGCEAGEEGDLNYDEMEALEFLDAICRETMRLYPPAPFIDRTTLKDTILPLAFPITDVHGTELKEVFIPKDTVITIAIASMNRSVKVWGPDVMEWKPQRWLDGLPESVVSAQIPGIYSHLMTFSGGKRSCLGFKFSQLEMKAVLCDLISTFRFSPSLKHSKVTFPMSTIVCPSIDGKPSLPLILEAIHSVDSE